MSAYLKFFELERSPFEPESQSKVVLGTKALRDALASIRSGLEEGAARICVNGQTGLGKTSLARALPKLLDKRERVAVILHPSTSWNSIRSSIARQWRVGEGGLARSNLLSFAREARLVLVVDQAETASIDILDHLDVLLSYRTEDDAPVVQSILFANLTRRPGSDPPPLIWWLDRIQTLELQFAPLPREGVGSYIQKHLKRAGWKQDSIFTDEASHAIHGYTGGIPGDVDRACERLLSEAADRNLREIDALFVHEILDLQPDAIASPYDSFEELVMEDEFAGADVTEEMLPEPPTSLETPLDPFASADLADLGTMSAGVGVGGDPGGDPDVGPDDWKPRDDAGHACSDRGIDRYAGHGPEQSTALPTLELVDEATHPSPGDEDERLDSSMRELEAYLSRPPSEEELREIRARGFGRIIRIAAVLALGLMVSGMLVQWLSSDAEESPPSEASMPEADAPALSSSTSQPTLFANPDGLSPEPARSAPLARLRGPVVPGTTTNVREPRPTPSDSDATPTPHGATQAGTARPAAPGDR
jgi:type II secretory pathway predicted ATPase ExeA